MQQIARLPAPPEQRQRAVRWPDVALYLGALRPRQWLKNAFLLVPLIAAGRLLEPELLAQAGLALIAFCLCASGAYVLDDLIEPSGDRLPSRRGDRAPASGQLPVLHAAVLMAALPAGAVLVALLLPPAFLLVLAVYYGLTLIYSRWLRDVAILDTLALAGLYTLRVIAGAAALGIALAASLLVFCVFLFFSLALVRRYAELVRVPSAHAQPGGTRAYLPEDGELLAALGVAAGCLAVLVLALSIDPAAAGGLLERDHLVGLVCMLLLYWISRMWLMAHRARMPDDPLIFALKDPVSRTLVILMSMIALIPA